MIDLKKKIIYEKSFIKFVKEQFIKNIQQQLLQQAVPDSILYEAIDKYVFLPKEFTVTGDADLIIVKAVLLNGLLHVNTKVSMHEMESAYKGSLVVKKLNLDL